MSATLNLSEYHAYVQAEAERLPIDARVRAKYGPEDLVNETFRRVVGAKTQFKGTTPEEARAYLRAVLLSAKRDLDRAYLDTWRNPEKANVAASEFGTEPVGSNLSSTGPRELGDADFDGDQSGAGLANVVVSPDSSPGSRAAKRELVAWAAAALAELPPNQREAIQLVKLDDVGLAEAARRMGCAISTVAGWVVQGLQNLKKLKPDT